MSNAMAIQQMKIVVSSCPPFHLTLSPAVSYYILEA